MPEGPEIRREANALARVLVDRRIERVDYRVPDLAAKARRLHASLASMSDTVLAYKNLTAAREPLLKWLESRS